MPSVYRPRRPRASPLWQIVHHAWDGFLADYERSRRKTHGPLRPDTVHVVEKFYRCGDLSAGFTRLQCPDCGHEKLLAFSCIRLRARLRRDKRFVTSAPPATSAGFARSVTGSPIPSVTTSPTGSSSSPCRVPCVASSPAAAGPPPSPPPLPRRHRMPPRLVPRTPRSSRWANRRHRRDS